MLTSREFKVAGAIGPCSSLRKLGGNVAETAIGEGGTNAWSLGGVDPSVTLAVYFEVTNAANNPLPPTKRRYLQFLTSYQHASGAFRLRCTTVAGQSPLSLSQSSLSLYLSACLSSLRCTTVAGQSLSLSLSLLSVSICLPACLASAAPPWRVSPSLSLSVFSQSLSVCLPV